MSLKFIPSRVPLFYDESLPGFTPPISWEGAKVRVKVKVKPFDPHFSDLVNSIRSKAEKKYPGATILVVPEFEEPEQKDIQKLVTASDTDKVSIYVAKTVPEALSSQTGRLIAYLVARLQKVTGSVPSAGREIQFQSVSAEDILSFKKVRLDFSRPGVRLVQGRNEDWEDASNGSGKTNLLSLLRVGLFGETSKGQACDELIRRESNEKTPSCVVVRYKNTRGQECRIFRCRKPARLQWMVEDHDRSSGAGKKRTGISTQELIEKSVGMSAGVFDHSVLIDQKLLHMARSFLYGTDKTRKNLLDEFLFTERFVQAGELVRRDKMRIELEISEVEHQLSQVQVFLSQYKSQLSEIQSNPHRKELQAEYARVKKALDRLPVPSKSPVQLHQEKEILENVEEEVEKIQRQYDSRGGELRATENQLQEAIRKISLVKDKKCPTCGQVMNSRKAEVQGNALRLELEQLHVFQAKHEVIQRRQEAKIKNLSKQLVAVRWAEQEAESLVQKRYSLQARLQDLRQAIKSDPTEELVQGLRKLIYQRKRLQKIFSVAKRALNAELAFLSYGEKVMSRSGIVNFLYAQACSPLNAVARKYAELFTGGVLQLRFSAKRQLKSGELVQEFDVQVINVQGGEATQDQSRGEEQLAAFMCVLCLRTLGPRTDVLILDEPTEGLDPVNSQRFAKGLLALEEEIPSILLASHNEYLKARFADTDGLLVVKEKGISRLIRIGAGGII